MSTEGDDAQRRGTKRERELSLALGAIVEHMTLVRSGAPFDTLDVSRHVKLVTTDEHWTAQARAGARTAVIMVGRSDVTQIRPYTPYTALHAVIYPASSMRAAMGAVTRLFADLRATGHVKASLPRMQTRKELYETLEYTPGEEWVMPAHFNK